MPILQVQVHQSIFRVVPVGDMFQQKIDEIFKELNNVVGIADNILKVGYDVNSR